jgi:outer membrane protein assembly factor BamB
VAAWTHTNGSPEHRIAHPALGAPSGLAWSVPIGAADSRRHRITASPVAAQGRIFTLDALAGVMAHDANGRPLWRADLTPSVDRPTDASGGGLAWEGGRLFVTTAFGQLAALDAETGRVRWVQDLGAAATGTPTVRDGIVYAVSRDGTGWALRADTGRIAWQVPGLPDTAGFVGPAGPAVSGELAVFPFSSGDVVAVYRRGGTAAWRGSVTGDRVGRALGAFGDVTGAPVFADGRVYVGNATGRTAAFDPATGERLWTARVGALGPVWPAGGSVFLVSDASRLVRLDAATGSVLWRAELPGFVSERRRRREAVFAHHGPVLAGGKLWVASTDGALRAFDPASGAPAGGLAVPGGASTAPIVVGGALYVVSKEGRLLAFR